MLEYNRERARENARKADTEDLLDRATIYRGDMEPDALYAIEEELRQRGVTAADIDAHARRREETGLCEAEGMPARCSFCARPAVEWRWGWHKLWGRLPVFPRPLHYCAIHRPATSR